jgi:hypothetical protein
LFKVSTAEHKQLLKNKGKVAFVRRAHPVIVSECNLPVCGTCVFLKGLITTEICTGKRKLRDSAFQQNCLFGQQTNAQITI